MSDDEMRSKLDELSRVADNIGKILGAVRIVVGCFAGVFALVATGAIWARSTSQAIEHTSLEVSRIQADRTATMANWTEWRRVKDSIDDRTIVILEQLEKRMAVQQALLERRGQ